MGSEQPVDMEDVKRLAYGPSSAGLPVDATTAVKLVRDKYPPEDGQHVDAYRQQTISRLQERRDELEDAPEKGIPLLRYTTKKMHDAGSFSLARLGGLSTGSGLVLGGGGKLVYEASNMYAGDEVSTVTLGLSAGSVALGAGMIWVSRNGLRPTYTKLLNFSEQITDQVDYYEEAIEQLEQHAAQTAIDELDEPSLDELDAIATAHNVDTIELDYDHTGEETARDIAVADVLTEPVSLSYYHPKGAYHVLAWVEDDRWVREDLYEPWTDLLQRTVQLYRDGRPVIQEETVSFPEHHAAAEGIEQAGVPDEWTVTHVDRPG